LGHAWLRRLEECPSRVRARNYAECLASFIRGTGLESPHVLGLSFGSGLALELYRWHPELPRSLILVSAYAGWAGSLPPEVAERRRQRMLQMVELPPEQWAVQWLPTLLSENARTEVREELKATLAEFHPDASIANLALNLRHPKHGDLTANKLVIESILDDFSARSPAQ
jgi:pimeloyl-ACP methyl ester carboxylesterase